MTKQPNLADVEVLLAERDAVTGWLARIDAAGSSVPPAVRDRVRQDYQGRLNGVIERLQGHGDAIAAKLAEDRAEQEAHAERANAASEALAEAQLRHLVGEYDQGFFETERDRHAADVARHEQALDAVAERAGRLEEVLSLIIAPARHVEASGAVASATSMGVEPVREAAPTPPEAVQDVVNLDEVELVDDQIDEQLLAIFDDPGELTEEAVELVDEAVMPEAPPASDRGPLSFRPGTGMPPEQERVIPSFGMPAEIPARFTPVAEPARSVPTPTPAPAPCRPARCSTRTLWSPARRPSR
ncbi:MAG: hypothetical protein IPP98_08835 [Gemmatimonadetes bacterium]|nr:hypothetical protein [Gemmatimonadota bacterium]